ncbi:MAG: HD domain-containing protein [Bacteroidales bacterium]|nr:HD domain-containing protein [Bacteroidales bacterium]
MNERRQFFEETLRATGRRNIELVLDYIEKLGFYEAPASSMFHLNEPGGLLEHSVNVYNMAMQIKPSILALKPEISDRLKDDSIAIAALLHDICKSNVYKPEVKRRKTPEGRWEDYQGYGVDYSWFPMGHGEKSVMMLLLCHLEITEDEMLAIRWHMGPWDLNFQSNEQKSSINAAKEKCPLLSLISVADQLAAGILEI